MRRKLWSGAALILGIFGTAVLVYPFWARYKAERVLNLVRTMQLGQPATQQLQEISRIVRLKRSSMPCSVGNCQVYSFLVTNGWVAQSHLVGLKGFGGEIGLSDSQQLVGYTLYAGEGWADTMVVYRRRTDPLKPFTVVN